MIRRRHSPRRGLASPAALITVVALTAVLTGLGTGLAAAPAWAAGSVTVSGPDGSATADPDYATEVTVRGTGFQSIRNGFGGVYVLFGWVDSGSSWKPSNGGAVGADYRYVPDSESKDNAGFQRFISFPGSDTESAAHAVMSDSGSWTVEMVVPGAVFESRDRDGKVSAVDCRSVTCGIITIGAHGVKNANNETFTPIRFAAPASTGSSGSTGSAGSAAPEASAAPAAGVGDVRVGVLSATVDAGTSLAFTGQGFTPGEQVVATLDNGLVSVGPLTAGNQGEVAAVMPVPTDARGGTHLLTLTGAASGARAETEIAVTASGSAIGVPAEDPVPAWLSLALLASIVVAGALVLTSIVVAIVRAVRRRRARRAAVPPGTAEAGSPPAPAPSAPAPSPSATTTAPSARTVESSPAGSAADAPTVELTAVRS
jgi:hypothetical protein